MKKLVLVTVVLLVVSPILMNFEWILGGYPWVKSQMEIDVRDHLASGGYKPADIQEIKAEYNRKLGEYTTQVIFRDDKNSIYYYDYVNGKIDQTGVSTNDRKKAKHLEQKTS